MRTAAIALIVLAALALLLRLSEKKFIYFPSRYPAGNWNPNTYGIRVEDVYFTTEDGLQLHGWFLADEQALATLLWCHGNAGNLSDRLDNLVRLARLPIHVFIFDYRGYGRSQGSPDEAGLTLDAIAAYDAVASRPEVDPRRIIVFGRSLGGPVAAEVALRRQVAAVILESTFTSARHMAWQAFKPFPVHWLIKTRFDTLDKVRRLRRPLLVIHGSEDEVVPFRMGRRVFEAAPEPKEFYTIEGAGHNDTYLVGGDAYFERLHRFIEQVGSPPE